MYCTVLYCTVVYCTVMYCTILCCNVLLYCSVLYCSVLLCAVLCFAVLCCAALHCTALHCTALCMKYTFMVCVIDCLVTQSSLELCDGSIRRHIMEAVSEMSSGGYWSGMVTGGHRWWWHIDSGVTWCVQ